MPFNSLTYFLFLPAVYLVFYVAGERARWMVLLSASLFFYAALNVPYLPAVLLLVAMTTYGFGIWLDQAESPKAKRAILWGSIAANVLILVVMKYLPFISENLKVLSTLLSLDGQIQPVKAFVAIGVSYYVFQAISYLFDIYLEIEKPERHFGYFALYLAFFPKLLQGPIEPAHKLLPQLRSGYAFDEGNMRAGLLLFAEGLFKKVVIADRLGLYVNIVYENVHAYNGLSLLCATYMYAIQIYFDFSGYTDMALGSARIFNIHLTNNFDSPYMATSVADFWRRWHISFSRWILQYVFKPLQLQWRDWRQTGTVAALIVTFLLSGLWHGASWCFVVWGGLHGLFLASSHVYSPVQKSIHKRLGLSKTFSLKVWQRLVTFNLVCFAWIFFRAQTLDDAYYVVTHLHNGIDGLKTFLLSHGDTDLLTLAMVLFGYMLVRIIGTYTHLGRSFAVWPTWCRWSAYYALLFTIVLFNVDSERAFIYMQF